MADVALDINTKKSLRRQVQIASLDDLRAEVERMAAADRTGALRYTGNWTPGQIFDHLAKFMRFSIDGFPAEARPPLWVKVVCRLAKGRAVKGAPPPAGIRLPVEVSFFLPEDNVGLGEGERRLLHQIDRIKAGERFEKPSPAFGPLTHEQWTNLHLGHARLHLSFLHPADQAAP